MPAKLLYKEIKNNKTYKIAVVMNGFISFMAAFRIKTMQRSQPLPGQKSLH